MEIADPTVTSVDLLYNGGDILLNVSQGTPCHTTRAQYKFLQPMLLRVIAIKNTLV